MPIPKPKADESKDAFLGRCMGDSVMNDDYPDNKQRYAVCNSAWNKKVIADALNDQIKDR